MALQTRRSNSVADSSPAALDMATQYPVQPSLSQPHILVSHSPPSLLPSNAMRSNRWAIIVLTSKVGLW